MRRAAHLCALVSWRGLARAMAAASLAGIALLLAVLIKASPAQAASPTPVAPPGCTNSGYGKAPASTPTLSDPSIVARIGGLNSPDMTTPDGVAIDTGDPRGRVFVANLTSGTLTVIDGRATTPGDIKIETSLSVGSFPEYPSMDTSTGRVFVAVNGACRIAVVDGRAATPVVIRTIDLPGNPSGTAFDTQTGRLFVAFPVLGQVLVFDRNLALETTLTTGKWSYSVALDAGHGLLYVGCDGTQTPTGWVDSKVVVVDARAATPTVLYTDSSLVAPTSFISDPTTDSVFIVSSGTRSIAGFHVQANGQLRPTASVPVDPAGGSTSTAVAALLLPASHQLLVPLIGSDRASVYSIGAGGTLTFDRYIPGLVDGIGAALDPATGRVFVAEESLNEVAVVALDQPTAPAPSIQYVLPGPLDISLAPVDVARSAGITALLMLLLGVPTPIFNNTLTANRKLIERWLAMRRPRRLRRVGPLARLGSIIKVLSRSWLGLVLYLGVATLVYAFLSPGFPSQDGARTLFATGFGIAVGTAVSQLPGEIYVRRHFPEGGRVTVALWTMGLAGACVLVTRITGVQPGYVYGIIGGFTFSVVLTREDRGRMAFAGMAGLLAFGFAAWIARIPFQPNVGAVGGGLGDVVNQLLTASFVSAVQGAAIGLIPLHYLAGEPLFSWSRRGWAILWAFALFLFAHVILYPVSSLEPHPSSTGVWTVAATVLAYGAVALSFWWYFWRRDRKKGRPRRRARTKAQRQPTTA